MKKQILGLSLLTISFAVLFTACKKEGKTDDNTNQNTEVTTHSADQSRFESETDAVANDANVALESYGSFTGRFDQIQTTICNATIAVDTLSNPRTITITYNGTGCFGYTSRTGVVVLSMAQGVHWKDAGAVLNVTYQNYKVTRISDNKSITINGVQTFTNVSGGLMITLPTVGTITHTITSTGISVKFDDNTTRTWQVAKQRVYSYANGTITTTGTHTEGNITNVAEWGTNRFGNAFTSAITQPLVIKADCNFRLASGQVTHKTANITAVATFGLDANGAATACPGANPYYAKVVWTGPNGNSVTVIWPY